MCKALVLFKSINVKQNLTKNLKKNGNMPKFLEYSMWTIYHNICNVLHFVFIY